MHYKDINIRDPFVLPYNGKYYLYGTRGSTAWYSATGLDVYVSEDLENWSEPLECFNVTKDLWADKEVWAPEVHVYNGKFYMFVSLRSDTRNRGTQILKSESPLGPFLPFTDDAITPKEWSCLDGTFHVDQKGNPYIVFCHEWVQVTDGEICAMRLSEDLSYSIGEPFVLFRASEPFWADKNKDNYVTDGPFLYRTENGRLLMIWSTFTDGEYVQAVAHSDNGDIDGNWVHDKPLFDKDGGHGMIFEDFNGEKHLILHSPNENPLERPVMFTVKEENGTLVLA